MIMKAKEILITGGGLLVSIALIVSPIVLKHFPPIGVSYIQPDKYFAGTLLMCLAGYILFSILITWIFELTTIKEAHLEDREFDPRVGVVILVLLTFGITVYRG